MDPMQIIEAFKERSAIMEHDGGLDRKRADFLALQEIAKRFGAEGKKLIQGLIKDGTIK